MIPGAVFEVREFGARGDGQTIDSPAIQAAIDAAADAGGGRVLLPAGTFASFTLQLRSHVVLELAPGATLLAADASQVPPGAPGYHRPEPNAWGDVHRYQDYGHSHWRNSLIWAEDAVGIGIIGTGRIDGRGLHHGLDEQINEREEGANKAIALKRCRRVLLRDFTLVRGGHFALLATGVDQLTIEHLTVDTQRDGLDIDCCRGVTIHGCRINAPHDDAIVLKSSYALGEARPTEQVQISDCTVSGFDLGTMVDGTYGRSEWAAPDGDGPTGRIKLGTESHGGFRDILIANCCFVRSRGLAIESVDGAVIENVVVSNLVLREIVSSPLFIRLGARLRGPAGTSVGAIRGVLISQVRVEDADTRFASIITGLPEHPIEEVQLRDITIHYRGGLTQRDVAEQPATLTSAFFQREPDSGSGPREPWNVPERAQAYPEPSMFGVLPVYGLYARHVRGLRVDGLRFRLREADERPVVGLTAVGQASFVGLAADRPVHQAAFVLRDVAQFTARDSTGLADVVREQVVGPEEIA